MGKSIRKYEPRSQQCVATAKNSGGEQCKNMAVRGTTVCRMHGGSTRAVKRKAAERVEVHKQNAQLAEFLAVNGYEPVENPLEALKDLAGEIVTVKDWLRGQVTKLDYQSHVQGEQIAAIMQLYSQFLDRSDKVLVNIARLNIDERLSKISTHQAQVMSQVMAETIMLLIKDDKEKQNQARVIVGQLIAKYDK
jgi:hypothetical protein